MNLAIIGGGDHALEVLNYIIDDNNLYKRVEKIFIVDINKKNRSDFLALSKKIYFLNNINKLDKIKPLKASISFGEPNLRRKCFLELKKKKINLISIIHKTSYISRQSIMSDGIIIAPKCVIAPFAKVQENVLINSGNVIGHHSDIGKHSVICPNSFTAGHSKVGQECFLGPNSSLIQQSKLNDYSRLSANSVLYTKSQKFSLCHGNPAKITKLYK